jgi:hypothetical protein
MESEMMNQAYNFVILDLESSNALAYPDTLGEAEQLFGQMIEAQPQRAEFVAIVGIDKEGSPVGTIRSWELGGHQRPPFPV